MQALLIAAICAAQVAFSNLFVLARSEASTNTNKLTECKFFAARFARVFSQAGVVAPPDSLTGGTQRVLNVRG